MKKMLRVRVIGSKDCPRCGRLLKQYEKVGFDCVHYNADDSNNQAELDKWHVVDMPVVDIIDDRGHILKRFAPKQEPRPKIIKYWLRNFESDLKVKNLARK